MPRTTDIPRHITYSGLDQYCLIGTVNDRETKYYLRSLLEVVDFLHASSSIFRSKLTLPVLEKFLEGWDGTRKQIASLPKAGRFEIEMIRKPATTASEESSFDFVRDDEGNPIDIKITPLPANEEFKMSYQTRKFYETLMSQVDASHTLRAVIIKASSNVPQVVVICQEATYDEVRFGIAPINSADRDMQITPKRFKWCDYKEWDSSQSEFEWESRGEEIPFDDALRIWKCLDIGYAAE